MNFLERKAMNKAMKHIGPYLDPGEALMEFEIGRVPQGQVALLATNLALYVCGLPLRGRPGILPYELLASCEVQGRTLVLRSAEGETLSVHVGPARPLAGIVARQIMVAKRLRDAEEARLEAATTARDRGQWVPLLLSQQDEGGPGVFRVTDGRPLFVTDSGMTHDYGWESYKDFQAKPEGFHINLGPVSGGLIVLETTEPEKWSRIFTDAGLARREPKA
jgi:hypothetical protein